MIRYRADGKRDSAFDVAGIARVNLGSPEAIVAAEDGRFVVGAGETERCGFGLPVASFDGLQEPDARVVGAASLDGRRLRLRLAGPSRRQTVRGVATAVGERGSESPTPEDYGRRCPVWTDLANRAFKLRGTGTAVIRLGKKEAASVRRARRVIVRVASRTSGREGRTARRVRVKPVAP